MSANDNAMVELANLSKTFGEELAVRDVNRVASSTAGACVLRSM